MILRCLSLIFFLLSFSLFSGERELFSPEEKKLLTELKGPHYLFEKMKDDRRAESFLFFSFILGVNALEDKTEVKRLDFLHFSLLEDNNLIREIQENFIKQMQYLEEDEEP